MKKAVSFIVLILLIFAFSVCSFAYEEPERLFLVQGSEDLSAEEVYTFAAKKGFGGVLFDARKSGSADFLWDYASSMDFQPFEVFTLAGEKQLKGIEPGRNIVLSEEISEETAASLLKKHKSEKLSFYLPFGDDEAFEKALYYYEKGFFKTLFAENLLS